MPFLFVDYDQGAGGERFCAGLSQSTQCEDMHFIHYPNGRTKVHDVFEQEFLKPSPNIKLLDSHCDLYTVVPTHRHIKFAKELLKDVYSIRIQMPIDDRVYNHVVNQRINKVLLTQEPTTEYFFGLLKILITQVGNTDFIKKINKKMTTLEIIMISEGIDITPSNIEKYINNIKNNRYPEPNFDYDMIIPYENLVYDSRQVVEQLKTKFGIEITSNWLDNYAIT